MGLSKDYTKNQDIIEIANTFAGLRGWTIKEWDVTPKEAMEVMGDKFGRTYNQDAAGLAGHAIPGTKTINLFVKGVKSQSQLKWTLCHELGHAIHFENYPNSTNWHTDNQEQFADMIGLQIEEIANKQ